jgi:hypothetical protein
MWTLRDEEQEKMNGRQGEKFQMLWSRAILMFAQPLQSSEYLYTRRTLSSSHAERFRLFFPHKARVGVWRRGKKETNQNADHFQHRRMFRKITLKPKGHQTKLLCL